MKKLITVFALSVGLVSAAWAANESAPVTQADLQALKALIEQQNAKIEAQARRIAELEGRQAATATQVKETAAIAAAVANPTNFSFLAQRMPGEGTQTNETGRIWTLPNGQKFYLADAAAGIFQPLTESGLTFQPYGYLVLEGVYNSAYTASPMYTDWVDQKRPGHGGHTSTLSVNDSILGFNLGTPETYRGWKFGGKFEFDLAGDDANHTDFHVRHLYWDMTHEETGWNILFGQTWHLWKMVTPNEIDGAWMENTGHPYRRSPQVRVTKKFDFEDSSLEARAGLVKNGPGMGGDRDEDGVQNNEQSDWCLFEGALLYDHDSFWESDRRWLVGLGGMYGRDKSRRWDGNSYDGPEDEYDSDMVMIAGKIPFLEKFTLTGQIFAGENLGGVQGGIGQTVGFDLNDPTSKGREIATVGGFVDLRYDLNDTWAFAVGYGFDDPTDSDVNRNASPSDDDSYLGRTFNSRSYADIFYQFSANLHFGLEYAYLTTDYYEDNSTDDHRIQGSVYFDF